MNSHEENLPIAGGGAGHFMSSSARSSVFVGSRCNPAVTSTQEFPTSGFHARLTRNLPCGREAIRAVPIAPSTHSGVCLKTKTIPTNRVNCVTVCAEISLRAAPVSKVTSSSQSPLAPGNGRLFLSSTRVSGSIDRGWLPAIYV